MSSRSSFDETARYWAEIYAGAPKKDSGSSTAEPESGASKAAGKKNAPSRDEIAIAGLQAAHVEQFVAFGFAKPKVVSSCSYSYGKAIIWRAF
jgi:ubiquitin-conjugating enzyme (huntingtin interacting protein 2)